MIAKQAASFDLDICDDCDNVHINLFDDKGRCFATAAIPQEMSAALIAELQKLTAQLKCRRPTQ